ncbi:MAG: type II secretion system protein [Candidatus Omnitrophota bacterium]|nr:type II secretion system protein [Candidatus Omnitrophota bacterium]
MIIIVGILAALGFVQYNKVMEQTRFAEATVSIGGIRNLAQGYYLEHNSTGGITYDSLSIGSQPGDFPSVCTPASYFTYTGWTTASGQGIGISATRCTSGGKEPQGSPEYIFRIWYNIGTKLAAYSCEVNGEGTWSTDYSSAPPRNCP